MQSQPTEAHSPARNLKERARHEAIRFTILFLYLWAMFLLFELHQYVVLSTYDIPFESWGLGLVNALVLAKVMVVAENIRFDSPVRSHPLVVQIVLKSIAFAILFIVVDTLEKVLVGTIHGKTLASSIPQFGNGGILARVIVGIILAVSLIPFFAFEEVGATLGRGQLSAILLRRRGSP
ncbi:hypothetical protein NK718_12835 [Alsobacter sp. SYSU M60028]|uniref:TRAP transporter small permease subunit n=1 Tax=Alsobacter ponti TaxID=2962936 RepID=A0ABT1LE81_9HYPH|nr:hypothetical protein [Alsobacter ponti]MCP8939403.1 hypothetical protein [Alsobacter ponti]